jgi:hypothetical protein
MAKQPFFPNDLEGQIVWMINFDENLPTYAAKYGLTPAQVSGVSNDREWLQYWFEQHVLNKNYSKGLTEFKNEVAYGIPTGGTPSVVPVPPPVGTVPTAVDPGVFPRTLAIANGIKVHNDYTVADGDTLGLEGAEIEAPNLANARPVLKLKRAGENLLDVNWTKQGLPVDGVELHVKRGAAVYVYLATDTTTPKYVDTYLMPATAEDWTYKGIYVIEGARIGLWSEEVTINVKAG